MSALKILVVDDEADIRALIKEILSDEGYDVIVASSASEARLFRKQDAPDLIPVSYTHLTLPTILLV